MGKSKAPPPPDYAAAAKEQGEQNLVASQQTAALNRPTQIDENGTQTWTLKPGADAKNPQAGDWVVENKLNATQQALKDQQDKLSGQFGQLAGTSLDSLSGTIGTQFDASGLPKASALTKNGLPAMGNVPTVPGDRASLSTAGLSAYGSVDPTTEASRQRVTDAMYSRQTALLDPRTKQDTGDLTSRLAAQGITEGSEAYNRAVDNQKRQQNEAYAAARNDAILAGGAEDTRIGTQNLNVAGFNNMTRAQQLAEQQTIAGFNNNNLDTSFSQGLAAAGMQNGNRAQAFNESQAVNTSENQLHQNALAEALQQRQLGLNETNALRTGNQVGGYNFQAYGGGGQVEAAPVFDATKAGYDAQLAATNANNAGKSALLGGLTSLGGAAIKKWG